MRFLSFVVLLFFMGISCIAQNKATVWFGGFNAGIDFNEDTATALLRPDNNEIWRASASICDSNGDLLFYTNGFRIFNSQFEMMQNGDSLNMGDYSTFGYNLSPTPDGVVIVPVPNTAFKYYVFHMDLNWINLSSPDLLILLPTHLFYSIVDISMNNGFGMIQEGEKNISILNDTLTQFGMQVVKHGNGRDYWLICHEYGSNMYYKFLIDNNGIHGPFTQEIGLIYESINGTIFSAMKFNQTGSKFLHLTYDSNCVEIFDFDRCKGELFNYNFFKVDSEMAYSYGASFSPSGKYIYTSVNFDQIRQYDLEVTDISSSQIVVGIDDGVPDPFPARFYLHQLSSDGKIYIINYDGSYSLHVINHPDSSGLACNFVQRGLKLLPGSQWVASAPNVPNYSLGTLSGSPCDTISTAINFPQSVFTFGLYPNPCYNFAQLNISGATEKAEVFLYSTFGQLLYKTESVPVNQFIHEQLPVKNLAAGMYLVKVKMGKKEFAQKLVRR